MKFLLKFFLAILFSFLPLFGEVLQPQNQSQESNPLLITEPNQQSPFYYQDFTIDESKIKNSADLPNAREEVRRQVDLILQLNLPSDILAFFKTIPLFFVRKSVYSFRGRYDATSNLIFLNIAPFVTGWITDLRFDVGKHTTLLDQLLHAYYHDILSSAPNNEILIFFEQAKEQHSYYAFLETHPDISEETFFAHTALAYLCNWSYNSFVDNRKEIKTEQPNYYNYLEQLFGPAHYSVE